MSRQMKSERIKRAVILEAQGIKESEITKAEGKKQAWILDAQGKAEAVRLEAEARKFQLSTEADGQAEAIYKVFESIHKGKATDDVIAIKYLEALKDISNGKASKIFLPLEASGILGSIGAIGEMFNKKENGEKEENNK
jgi:regulator of protease activity HflC (stomatin/prohibitin superfamily)